MKYTEAVLNRIFILRLEHGDKLPDTIENFAKKKSILRGICILVGGVDKGSKIVVGPEDGDKTPPIPMIDILDRVNEIAGIGTIFPDEKGTPILHMHAACGRKKKTQTGCIRPGIKIWHIGEVIIMELNNSDTFRIKDNKLGFQMLEIQE